MPSVTRRARRADADAAGPGMEVRLLAALERRLAQGDTITSLSVDALAREAGIARATFYLHFRDKGALIARLIDQVEDEVVGAGGLWFEHAEDATYADLRAALERFLAAYAKHHAILSAAAETAPYDAGVAPLYQRMLGRFIAETRGAIARIAAAGRAHSPLPVMLAQVLAWSANHCYVAHAATLSRAEQRAFVDALTHLVWYAVFAQPPAVARTRRQRT